jgi:hypothetical protein
MPSKTLKEKEIRVMTRGLTDPVDIAKIIETETRMRCAAICEDIYKRSMKEWRGDNHRYNLGYAHGADECVFQMTGRGLSE